MKPAADRGFATAVSGFFEYVFEQVLGKSYNLISFYYLVIESFARNFPRGIYAILDIILKQIYFIGIRSVKNTLLIGFFIGIVVNTQIAIYVREFGGWTLVGKVIAVVMVRELLPIIMAIMIVARSGTAVASELSLMKIHGETMTLNSLGIDLLYYVVSTRMVAFVVSLTVVTTLAAILSVISGALTTYLFQDISLDDYFFSFFSNLTAVDILLFYMKTVLFGMVIGTICCYYGLTVRKQATEVPQASTNAVMSSFYYLFLANIFLDFGILIWQ